VADNDPGVSDFVSALCIGFAKLVLKKWNEPTQARRAISD
jgi:hypothetical protein